MKSAGICGLATPTFDTLDETYRTASSCFYRTSLNLMVRSIG